jgi:uroporphyrinogen decarboxylase
MRAAPLAGEDALFLRACRREPVERTPIWIMRQAGRYLPEYRAIRERRDFLECCRTPELAAEITLQPVVRLGVDAAILFSDILVPLPGMGVHVEFNPAPQLAHPIRCAADVTSLRVPDARESTPFVLEAVRLIRRQLGGRVPLIGFAGAPFTMATYLVEGGGSKSFAAIKGLLFGDTRTAHRLLGICAETVASYLSEQVKAGAQAAMLFDTWAGLLGPEDVRSFALPYARRVFEAVREAAEGIGARVPLIYYAGDAAGWIEACTEISADVVGLDWRMGLDAARARIGTQLALQGNLDPTILLGSRTLIRQRARGVLRAARGVTGGDPEAAPGPAAGHIFNLGHGILPQTPPDHARLLVDSVREFSEVPS